MITVTRTQSDRPRGTRVLLLALYIIMATTCLSGAAALLTHWQGIAFSRIIGAVFLTFGLFKIVLAIDAYTAPTAVAPMSDQRQESGTPGMFRMWMRFKVVTGLLSVVVGIVLIVHNVAMLDHIPAIPWK